MTLQQAGVKQFAARSGPLVQVHIQESMRERSEEMHSFLVYL